MRLNSNKLKDDFPVKTNLIISLILLKTYIKMTHKFNSNQISYISMFWLKESLYKNCHNWLNLNKVIQIKKEKILR